MAKIVENTPQRLALQSGSTSVTLDKAAGTATLQRKIMFISLKPTSVPLTEIRRCDARQRHGSRLSRGNRSRHVEVADWRRLGAGGE